MGPVCLAHQSPLAGACRRPVRGRYRHCRFLRDAKTSSRIRFGSHWISLCFLDRDAAAREDRHAAQDVLGRGHDRVCHGPYLALSRPPRLKAPNVRDDARTEARSAFWRSGRSRGYTAFGNRSNNAAANFLGPRRCSLELAASLHEAINRSRIELRIEE